MSIFHEWNIFRHWSWKLRQQFQPQMTKTRNKQGSKVTNVWGIQNASACCKSYCEGQPASLVQKRCQMLSGYITAIFTVCGPRQQVFYRAWASNKTRDRQTVRPEKHKYLDFRLRCLPKQGKHVIKTYFFASFFFWGGGIQLHGPPKYDMLTNLFF